MLHDVFTVTVLRTAVIRSATLCSASVARIGCHDLHREYNAHDMYSNVTSYHESLCIHYINLRHSEFLTDTDAPPTTPSG